MDEVIVACAVWGDWPSSRIGHTAKHNNRGGKADMQATYIQRLANGVARNMSIKHRFVCFADDISKVPKGIEAWKLDVSWFCRGLPKAYVYGAPNTGCNIPAGTPILIFDLDNVIVGNLDSLVNHGHELVARERVGLVPKFVPDGDIIFSVAGSNKAQQCAAWFHQEVRNHGANTYQGDEREVLQKSGAECWGKIRPGQVLSYKQHCRGNQNLPNNARVVSFHGKPLPDQVNDAWVKEHWK